MGLRQEGGSQLPRAHHAAGSIASPVLQRLLQRLEPTVILGCCSGLEACDTFVLVILSFGAAVWGIALGLPLRGSRP